MYFICQGAAEHFLFRAIFPAGESVIWGHGSGRDVSQFGRFNCEETIESYELARDGRKWP
jgi:hypothetical protein